MRLSDWSDKAHTFTRQLSELNRYLAFAGIAIIWIFKTDIAGNISIPEQLFSPLVILVLALFLDFLQYVYSATVWTLFFRYHENNKQKNPEEEKYKTDDVKAPKILPNLSYILFFYPKVILNIIGYILIISYMLSFLR
jgi:hypothetical protein